MLNPFRGGEERGRSLKQAEKIGKFYLIHSKEEEKGGEKRDFLWP